MAVPTTETAADKLEERRILSGEIAALKQEKESLQREVKEYAIGKTALLEELGKHLDVSELKDAVLENIRERLRTDIGSLEATKGTTASKATEAAQELEGILKRIREAKEVLKPAEEGATRAKATLAVETAALNEFRVNAGAEEQGIKDRLEGLKKEEAASKENKEAYDLTYAQKMAEITGREQTVATREEDVGILEDRYARKVALASPEQLDAAIKDLERIQGLVAEASGNLADLRTSYEKEMHEKGTALVKVSAELATATEELRGVWVETAKKRGEITTAETALANKGAKLADYEAKLRAKCLELYPELEIII